MTDHTPDDDLPEAFRSKENPDFPQDYDSYYLGSLEGYDECLEATKAADLYHRVQDLEAAAQKVLTFHQRGVHTLDDASRRALIEALFGGST